MPLTQGVLSAISACSATIWTSRKRCEQILWDAFLVEETMKKTLRVLAVEDSEDDILLLSRELRRSGYDLDIERVETAEAMAASLDGREWDIILADYYLPLFGGLEALNMVKERGLDLPFIIVSGVIGEETAVAAMKAGAHDYIMKDNLARLSPAIDRALQEVFTRQERRRLEDQLRQAQKMEAVGLLAGGIAHDFNNILTAIMGYGSLLQSLLPTEDPLRTYVDQILTASVKAATLTQSLLAFSRKQVLSIEPVDVNGVIENISKLLSRIMGEHIEVKTDLSAIPLHVMADKGQLEQVLMNLATNSRDVMPEGGCFVVSTEMIELDDSYAQFGDYLQTGKYVSISASDTGFGMDEETRQKIFEPFFTTKEAGKGTGLGLSIVYGIIKQHKGFVEVQSSRGRGTTFRMLLPMVEEGTESHNCQVQDRLASGGSETILVAEDNEAVRDLVKDVLEKSGYRVIHAVDGEDAVARFNESPQAVDLALLDVVMPKKGGVRVFEELQRGKPELKVLFMSGYVNDVEARKEISEKGLSFLKKPLSLDELLFKIREILDR